MGGERDVEMVMFCFYMQRKKEREDYSREVGDWEMCGSREYR